MNNFIIYLLVCALTTYTIRVIPLVLIKKKITNGYVLSFLHYMPPTILAVMTIPAVFDATGTTISAIGALGVALAASIKGCDLLKVAVYSSLTVLVIELIMNYLI